MKAAEYNMKMAFVLSLITAGITFIFGLVNL
jgi:hypothetical protein